MHDPANDVTIEWDMDKILLMPGRAIALLRFYKNRVDELLEANNRYLERARQAEAALRSASRTSSPAQEKREYAPGAPPNISEDQTGQRDSAPNPAPQTHVSADRINRIGIALKRLEASSDAATALVLSEAEQLIHDLRASPQTHTVGYDDVYRILNDWSKEQRIHADVAFIARKITNLIKANKET